MKKLCGSAKQNAGLGLLTTSTATGCNSTNCLCTPRLQAALLSQKRSRLRPIRRIRPPPRPRDASGPTGRIPYYCERLPNTEPATGSRLRELLGMEGLRLSALSTGLAVSTLQSQKAAGVHRRTKSFSVSSADLARRLGSRSREKWRIEVMSNVGTGICTSNAESRSHVLRRHPCHRLILC
jgi:hypothetical protein